MSRHEFFIPSPIDGTFEGRLGRSWIYGWDQSRMSFYLQVIDSDLSAEENPVVWIPDGMYEVEDLVREAAKTGHTIDHDMQVKLYREKDEGR